MCVKSGHVYNIYTDPPKRDEVCDQDGSRLFGAQHYALVREGAALLEKEGDKAYPELRKKGTKWFRDDTYFFVWAANGMRTFHAADPGLEGKNGSEATDVLGRPYGCGGRRVL